jgi:hypothetical protein
MTTEPLPTEESTEAPPPPTEGVDLVPLAEQLAGADFDVSRGLGASGGEVFTYDETGVRAELPDDAAQLVHDFLEQVATARATAAETPPLSVQEAADAIAAATTIAALRDAMLDLVEALTGTVPSA